MQHSANNYKTVPQRFYLSRKVSGLKLAGRLMQICFLGKSKWFDRSWKSTTACQEIMWEGFKLVIWWQELQHAVRTKTVTEMAMSPTMMMFGFGFGEELWVQMDTRCEPSCLSQISPRDSERPSRPLVESTRVHSMYYVLHTRDSERDPPVLLHCRVVLSCALCSSVQCTFTNYKLQSTSYIFPGDSERPSRPLTL